MAQQYNLPNKNNRVELKAPPRPPMTQPPVPRAPVRGDPRGMTQHIREMAAKYKIDPDVAMRVAKSEGLAQFLGDNGASGGAFQLYTKGGLGNEFQKETGLSPLDEANEKASIEYAMKRAAQGGWGPWVGARKIGLGQWDGITRDGTTAVASAEPLDPTPNVGAGATTYETDVASTTTKPDEDTTTKDEKKKSTSEKYGNAFGEGLESVGKAYAAGNKTATAQNPNMNVPAAVLPVPPGVQPMVDAKRVEAQRQQLAIAMQRLNSGKLV